MKNKLSASYQNQMVNAVKLFFQTVQNRKLNIEQIHRPKKPKTLPNVLSKEEIKAILEAHGNIKHRAMLSLIYACGLRRSELLNLKPADIDSKRGILLIKQAKERLYCTYFGKNNRTFATILQSVQTNNLVI